MMESKSFWKSGHKPTLFGAFMYFDISFMIWGMLGPLAVIIAMDYPMTPLEKANLVALPILGGSILRLVLGFMSDYIGPKLTAQIGMLVTLVPLLLGWLWVDSLSQLYVVALLLGVAGASFAAALPLQASGTQKNIKVWPWELPEQAIVERCSPRYLLIVLPLISAAGRLFLD